MKALSSSSPPSLRANDVLDTIGMNREDSSAVANTVSHGTNDEQCEEKVDDFDSDWVGHASASRFDDNNNEGDGNDLCSEEKDDCSNDAGMHVEAGHAQHCDEERARKDSKEGGLAVGIAVPIECELEKKEAENHVRPSDPLGPTRSLSPTVNQVDDDDGAMMTAQDPLRPSHEETRPVSLTRYRSVTPPPPVLHRTRRRLQYSHPGALAVDLHRGTLSNNASNVADDPIEAMLVNEQALLEREQSLELREQALRQQLDALREAQSQYLQGQVVVDAVAVVAASTTSSITMTLPSNGNGPLGMNEEMERCEKAARMKVHEKIRQETQRVLYGREEEYHLFCSKIEQLKSEVGNDNDNGDNDHHANESLMSRKKQLILVRGVAGSGKSSLVMHGLQSSETDDVHFGDCFIVRGKFNIQSRSQPYAGVAMAYDDICEKIVVIMQREDPLSYQSVCDTLRDELGLDQLKLLQKVVPKINQLMFSDSRTRSDQPDVRQFYSSPPSDVDKNRLDFCFARFIEVVNRQIGTPLIMVMDDLHFADAASLGVIDLLMSGNTSSFMIVGIYRSNELNDQLHSYLQDWCRHDRQDQNNPGNSPQASSYETTEIEVSDLSLESVDQMIKDLFGGRENGMLDEDDSGNDSLSLAQVILEKTNGNPLFIAQLIDTLIQDRTLVRFQPETRQWDWNAAEIRVSLPVCDNVVDLLKGKMVKLSQYDWIVQILKVAASLGSTFEMKYLKLVLEQLRDEDHSLSGTRTEFLGSAMRTLEKEGYVMPLQDGKYSWTHDKIQEAATSLISSEERAAFNSRIGNILVDKLSDQELDTTIFAVTNLLNDSISAKKGAISTSCPKKEEKPSIVELNFRASQKAISISAFESAAKYAKLALSLLDDQNGLATMWSDESSDLLLQLYSIGARAEGHLGNIDTMEKYCRVVLAQVNLPISDKLDVYNTWIDSMMIRGMVVEAADLMLSVLKNFNCRFAKNPALIQICTIRDIVNVKANLKTLNATNMKKMEDTTTIETMKLLDKLATCMFHSQDDRLPLAVLRNYKYTMKLGFCDFSPPAFATTGIIISGILGDIQGGSKYAEHALLMMEKSATANTMSRTLSLTCGMTLTYTKPIRTLLVSISRGYEVGLQTGDTESAMYCAIHELMIKFELGHPLQKLEATARQYCNKMLNLKCEAQHGITRLMLQGYLNLIGLNATDDPTRLTGEIVSEEELNLLNTQYLPAFTIWNWQTVFMTYYGDYVRHAERILKDGHDYHSKNFPADNFGPYTCFLQGLSCFAAVRITGKRKYAKIGRIQHAKIKNLLLNGNPNVKHYESILEAESIASSCGMKGGKKFMAVKQYEVAILHAETCGSCHDAAIACQRLADFYMTTMEDTAQAGTYFQKSINHWSTWGALAMVKHIQERHGNILHNN